MRTASLLLALALVGCGVKKETHQKALDQIKLLDAQLSDARRDADDRARRIAVLEADLTDARGRLDASTRDADTLRGEKAATEVELAELRRQREAAEARLAAYRELQARMKKLVETGALEVVFRNGQMTLKLPAGVLFPSASAALSKQGRETIRQVAEALATMHDRRFLVAGHTDAAPIKTRAFPNNWYLSTARAVSVVEEMIAAGFPADKLAAAGYADKDPVGDNATAVGREQNRRIEIILVPDLSELPQLAEEPR